MFHVGQYKIMPEINLGNFEKGISSIGKMELGKWLSMTNMDIHSDVGIAQPQLAMENETGVVNEECYSAIVPSGDVYFFSKSSGKIWKRTEAGVYSLVHTNANEDHNGAYYFNGFLWYWTEAKLGYFDLVSTWTDSFATFNNAETRGWIEINNTLLIADGRDLARIDSSNVFSASELTLPATYSISEMISIGDDVLIGTYIKSDVKNRTYTHMCKVFKWNTIDVSWTAEDIVYELGLNMWLKLDNLYLAQIGENGRFYYWNGARMAYFGRIYNLDTSVSLNTGGQVTTSFKGRALFSVRNKIYSIHSEDPQTYSYAFCHEYTCTDNIGSIIVKDSSLIADVKTSGVDILGSDYATATITTPEIQTQVSGMNVIYDSCPSGIGIETKVQGEDFDSQDESTNVKTRTVYFDGGLETNASFTSKITLTPQSQAYTNDPSSGVSIDLEMTDTSIFQIGDIVMVSSSAGAEEAKITSIDEDVSITVDLLDLNHTTSSPLVQVSPKIKLIKIKI